MASISSAFFIMPILASMVSLVLIGCDSAPDAGSDQVAPKESAAVHPKESAAVHKAPVAPFTLWERKYPSKEGGEREKAIKEDWGVQTITTPVAWWSTSPVLPGATAFLPLADDMVPILDSTDGVLTKVFAVYVGKTLAATMPELTKQFGQPDEYFFLEPTRDPESSAAWITDAHVVIATSEKGEKNTMMDDLYPPSKGIGGVLVSIMKRPESADKNKTPAILDKLRMLGVPKQFPYVGDNFTLGNFRYVVESIEFLDSVGSEYLKQTASEGAVFIVVRYTIENTGMETATIVNQDIHIQDFKGRRFTPSSNANLALASTERLDLMVSQLQPGISKKQALVFEVPESVVATPNGPAALVIPAKGILDTQEVVMKFNDPKRHGAAIQKAAKP